MNESLDTRALPGLVSPFALSLVVLFGSRARGRAHRESDIDLGVLTRDGRPLGHRQLAALHVALSRWADGRADIVDLATPDAVFRFEVVSQGTPLFEAEPGVWKGFVARTLIDHDDIAPFVEACIASVGRAARERRNR
jgi:predicted nucleotidyltransferase